MGGYVAELERLVPSWSAHSEDSVAEPAAAQRRAAVRVASPGEPLEAGQEAFGGGRRGDFREDVLQPTLCVDLRLAFRAGRQMRQHPLAGVVTEFAVHQGGEPVSEVLLGEEPLGGVVSGSTHAVAPLPPPRAGTRGTKERRSARASGERCARALRSCERPRWMRERTVPSLTPRVAAISS